MANNCIALWNARSLIRKVVDLKYFLVDHGPILVGITETWLTPSVHPKFSSYNILRHDRIDRRGGGLLFLIRNTVSYAAINLKSFPQGKLEILAIKALLSVGWVSILLVYNPCKDLTTTELEHYVQQLNGAILVMGDFNAHHYLWEPKLSRGAVNKSGVALYNYLLQSTQFSLITPPGLETRYNSFSAAPATLDLFVGSPVFQSATVSGGPYMGSDHIPIILSLPSKPVLCDLSMRQRWRLPSLGGEVQWSQFQNTTLLQFDEEEHLDLQVVTMSKSLHAAGKVIFSLTSGRFGSRPHHLWWNDGCKVAIRKRNTAFNWWRSHPSKEACIAYRKLAASCRRLIIETKRAAWREVCSKLNFATTGSQAWGLVKKMTGNFTPQCFPLTINGQLVADNMVKAEMFARANEKIFSSPDPLSHRWDCMLKIQSSLMIQNTDLGCPFTSAELEHTLRSLHKGTSVGHDFLPNEFLIHLSDTNKDILLQIYNTSWTTGYYPAPWKFSVIVPILKPGKDQHDPAGYRAIHLLPCPGKVLEKMVNNRLVWWMERHNFHYKSQYGFRPSMGTIDCLLQLENFIHVTFDNRDVALVMFIDLQSAFDTCSHIGVLYKLALFNIQGAPLRWMKSFLLERQFAVSVDGVLSSSYPVTRGVPQGSSLSPTLFTILLSDIPRIPSAEILVYADDIALCVRASDMFTAQVNMQQALDKLASWMKNWGLCINPIKSKLTCFTRKRIPFLPRVHLDLQNITLTHKHRFLGLVLDGPLLTWKHHIDYLQQNCLQRLNVMRRVAGTTWGAPADSLLKFYISYIRSKMDYGCVLYGAAATVHLKKLDILHNTALRIALGAFPSSPVQALLIESGLPALVHRRERLMAGKFIALSTASKSNYMHTMFREFLEHPPRRVTKKIAFLQRATKAWSNHIPLPVLFPLSNVPLLPPYSSILDGFDLSLHDLWTKKDNPIMAGSLFREFLQTTYLGFLDIYTDGSKRPFPFPSTSSAIYIPKINRTINWKLDGEHSVMFAELFAIYKALCFCVWWLPPQKIVIFTDSINSIISLKARDKTQYAKIRSLIYEQLLLLSSDNGWRVRMCWIPSHVGICGNEIVDAAAALAHDFHNIEFFPLETAELLVLSRKTLQLHIDRDNLDFLHFHPLGIFYPTVPVTRPPFLSRRLETAIFRMKIGHTGLNNHLYRLGISHTPDCPHCLNQRETIEHCLLHCPAYVLARQELRTELTALGASGFTILTILGTSTIPDNHRRLAFMALQKFLISTGTINRI